MSPFAIISYSHVSKISSITIVVFVQLIFCYLCRVVNLLLSTASSMMNTDAVCYTRFFEHKTVGPNIIETYVVIAYSQYIVLLFEITASNWHELYCFHLLS